MAVLSIQNLLLKFGAGKSPNSGDYLDLIDTLADDRNAVYFSATAPADTGANPLWFNTSTNVLSVYSNEAWSNIDLSLKAPLASPTLTGTPLAPTATAGTNTTQIATTAFVKTAVDNVVAAAPGALDTLDELALALNDDANFATTVTNSLAGKVSTSGGSTITASGAAVIPVIAKGAASQTANLQEWQNSAGTVITRVRPDGQIGVGSTLITSTNFFVNNTFSTTHVVATMRGAASQTANLQEWQNSSGSVLASISSNGAFTTAQGIVATGNYASSFGGGVIGGVIVTVKANSASNKALVVQGAASQTANLQEWQDSAGTVLAKVDQTGYMWSPTKDVAAQSSWTGAVTLSQTDSLKTYIKKQLTGNTTVTVSDGVAGKTYSCTLELQQDTTGSRSIILKGCRTAYGVTLVLTTTASATDIVRLEWNGTYWTAFMGAAQISVPSSWV